MKPLVPTHNDNARFDGSARTQRPVFPKTDCYFKAPGAADFGSRCGRTDEPSFRCLSDNYFSKEAPVDFAVELALFTVIVVTAVVPIVSNARAVAHLLHSIGAF